MRDRSVVDKESFFSLEELFFSHTDSKGKILYGNDVFVRVSEYVFSELEGKPHNIIRHPDMPKAIFKLLWDYILSGKSIISYVKNRSKNGKYYWVIALVTPFEGGFLSIRLKPTSNTFELIPNLYSKALQIEREKTVEESLNYIVSEIQKLGYPDYDSFMFACLNEEMKSRYTELNQDKDQLTFFSKTTLLDEMEKKIAVLNTVGKEFEEKFSFLKLHCINLLANIENYGDAGRAMAVTSQTFGNWGEEVKVTLVDFLEKLQQFRSDFFIAKEAVSISQLQTEMALTFKSSKDSREEYIKSLDELSLSNKKITDSSLKNLVNIFNDFVKTLNKLNESLMAFKIIRLNSRIESAHLPDGGAKVLSTVEGLSQFILEIETKGNLLKSETQNINKAVNDFVRLAS